MTPKTMLIAAFLLAFGFQAFAQPKLPFYDWGAEPCEYCLYGQWTAKTDVTIYASRGNRSKVAFLAKRGEKLTAVTGVVITTQAGFGTVLEPTTMGKYDKATDTTAWVNVDRNEDFRILTYHGEGNYTVWRKGQLLEAGLEGRELKILRPPKFIWWVKIKNKKGQIGWTRMVQSFEGPHEV